MSGETRTRTISLCMNIEGFMRNSKYPNDYTFFEHDDGTPMSPEDALAFLALEKAKGHKVIPCSAECGNPCKHADNGCAGFDFDGKGCPGRYTKASHKE
jgi:hypothetical protein